MQDAYVVPSPQGNHSKTKEKYGAQTMNNYHVYQVAKDKENQEKILQVFKKDEGLKFLFLQQPQIPLGIPKVSDLAYNVSSSSSGLSMSTIFT
jgi:hypothetical protein